MKNFWLCTGLFAAGAPFAVWLITSIVADAWFRAKERHITRIEQSHRSF